MDLTQVSSSSSSASRPDKAFASDSLNVAQFDERPFLKRLGIADWLFAVVMVAGAG
ncbi:MAG TPA: c-type cytochrome biogenesis protein CcsB, partial [Paraburkholderia sp.]|nr:c-type cytochrome biogenesis protein CcsB [Paraburkholderia sp.]